MATRFDTAVLVGGLLLVGGCHRPPPPAPAFALASTSPALGADAPPLLLNDSITLYFSAPVAPLSVTPESVALVDEAGLRVPGTLRVGANWVTFVPRPPLAADLADGTFRPGASYRLEIAGAPRPDAVRARDGRWLAAGRSLPLRAAARGERLGGGPEPLRPIAGDLPFLLRAQQAPQSLAGDAPRLYLHFSLPLLPPAVAAEALEVRLLRQPTPLTLLPQRVRVVDSPFDEFPGSTLEIDLGPAPRALGEDAPVALRAGDWLSVALRSGPAALRDYAGNPVLPAAPQYWSVVAGDSVPLLSWPDGDAPLPATDRVLPGFEVQGGRIRPQVRVETGDGSLGLFAPRRDTVLRPGQPFDRGDGTLVVSRGSDFPFLGVHVPAGVVVRVEAAAAPVRVLAVGSIAIDGELALHGGTAPLPPGRLDTTTARELLEAAVVALAAGGEVAVRGRIQAAAPPASDGSPLTVLSAGRSIRLDGEVPFNTVFGVEPGAPGGGRPPIVGAAAGRRLQAAFTYGLPAGAEVAVQAHTSWRRLPLDRDGGVVRLVDADPRLQVGWRAVAEDPQQPGRPDPRGERLGAVQVALDRQRLTALPGGFLRFELTARVVGGQAPPSLRAVLVQDG